MAQSFHRKRQQGSTKSVFTKCPAEHTIPSGPVRLEHPVVWPPGKVKCPTCGTKLVFQPVFQNEGSGRPTPNTRGELPWWSQQPTKQQNQPEFAADSSADLAKLNFLRLLSPKTRENRWMNVSWHHLGEYKRLPNGDIWSDRNSVDDYPSESSAVSLNRSSVFKPVIKSKPPTDFKIHPDWI